MVHVSSFVHRKVPATKRNACAAALVIVLVGCLGAPRASAQAPAGAMYKLTEIPLLAGTVSCSATGINNKGDVAGVCSTAAIPNSHGFLYINGSSGAPTDLGTLGSYVAIMPTGINDGGQIVGYAGGGGQQTHAFLYSSGAMMDLGVPPGGLSSAANAINNGGQIVGIATFNPNAPGGTSGFSYSGGSWTNLGVFQGSVTYAGSDAFAVNNSGQVVGACSYCGGSGTNLAFLYANGTMTDLGALSGDFMSQANGINDKGEIVGSSNGSGDGHAFLYSGGRMKDLGVPPGATDTSANAINHMGTVVGSAYVGGANYHAFVYAMGKITDLNTLIPASYGLTLTNAVAINNAGQIAATGYVGTNTSATQAYVLTPCVTFNVQLSAVYGPGGIALNEMKAVFTPASGQAISEAAAACGFVGFNFRQWVTNRPCPSPLSLLPTDPAKLPKANYCSVDENGNPTGGLTAPPEFPDPPPGSYNKDKYNPYPYYYEWQGAELWMTSSWMTSVYFADAPGDVCLPATDLGTLLLQPAQCILPIDTSGYQGFTTTLVGMIAGNPPTPSVPLCTWTWRSLWTGVATNLGDVENISAAQGSCTKQ